MKCLACHRLSTWEQQLRWFPFFWKGLGGWTGSRAREEGKRSPGEAGTGTLKKTTAGRRLVSSWGPDTHSLWS